MTKILDIIGQSRRDVLYKLITDNYKSINHFCTESGEDYAAIYRYIHKNVKMSDKVVRRFEGIFDKPMGFFDQQVPKTSSVDIPVIDNLVATKSKLSDIIAGSKRFSLVEQRLLTDYNWEKSNLFMIIANDDSMSPIIKDKTEVMIDSSQAEIENNKIYAIKIGTDIYIRKLIKSPVKKTITMVPENKADFTTDEINPSDMLILGRVVYLKSVLL